MSKYTEAQLNGMNKTNLVALALELGIQLSSLQSGPLKGSDVEKTMLDLARQAANIKSNDEARKEAHETAVAKIKADTELALKKLELDYADTNGLDASALAQAYKTIEEKSKLAIEDLSFGLQKAEVETKAKIEELDEKLTEAKLSYEKSIEDLKQRLENATAKTNLEVETLNLNHKRVMEQTAYDNKIALRDENLEAADKIAATHGKIVVDDEAYQELVSKEATSEEDIKSRVDAAVKAAESKLYAETGSKYAGLKSSTDSQIALLENDKKYLSATIGTLEERVAELSAQIKLFPEQLKEAVAAAKADVTINQDNKK